MNKPGSRKTASLISTIIGLINSVITICLTFLVRSIVLKEFGVEYVGLYSLLSQTVGIIAGVDGGISSALFIRMHKPIAENNLDDIQNSYFLVRVVYHVRGILVFVVGLIVALFLPKIANTSIDMTLVLSCYFVFLLLNSISYFFIYDFFMLETVQKRYIASGIACIVNIIVTGINIFCVYRFHNYLIYITITSINQVVSYFICRLIFRKIRKSYYRRIKIEKRHFKEIVSLLGMALHTISNILITNSDTIMMSTLLTLVVTGYYANYHLILTGVNTLAMQLALSIKDPFRNLAMTSTDETAQINIKRLLVLYSVVIGSMGITYAAMADTFVGIFWGSENIITNPYTVYLLSLSLYLNIISNPIVDYYYCKEYYKNDKMSPAIEILLNIFLSVVFAKIIGLNGIILGTVITYIYRLVHRSKIIYNNLRNGQIKPTLFSICKTTIVFLAVSFGFRYVVNTIFYNKTIVYFLLCSALVFGLSVMFLCLLYSREKEWEYYKAYFLELVKKIFKRR